MTFTSPKDYLIAIFVGIFWGFVCMHFAKKRGRDPKGWFIIGLLFSLFGLAFLLLLPAEPVKNEETIKPALNETLAAPLALINSKLSTLAHRKWYYLDSLHNRVGPVDLDTLKKEKSEGIISSKTYLWTEGMLDWKKLNELSYLRTELD